MWQREWGLDGIEYEPHKSLPSPSRQKCDFYLTDFDLWVEYDGLMDVRADDKLTRKDAFYEKHGLKHLTITRDNWELALYEVLFCS